MSDSQKFRFHQIGLYHLPTAKRFYSCAYTQKILKLSKMLRSLGHEVYFYGPEGMDKEYFTKTFETHTLVDIQQSFGSGDNRFELGYDWEHSQNTFRYDKKEPLSKAHLKFLENAHEMIRQNCTADDFILAPQGKMCVPIYKDLKQQPMVCEPGIGYLGSVAPFRAFESRFIQNYTYGDECKGEYLDGNFLDRVIPNYFDEEEFPLDMLALPKDDYYLYIGRWIKRKGIEIAYAVTRVLGKKLVVAGQCDVDLSDMAGIEYVGVLNPQNRAAFMAHAIATFVPTLYLEPFGGVNVESQLMGTPVICTNYGAFPETVVQGVTGFLCNRFSDFKYAAQNADKLDPHLIRRHAERYLMENVKYQYQEWFEAIARTTENKRKGMMDAWYIT